MEIYVEEELYIKFSGSLAGEYRKKSKEGWGYLEK